MTPRQGNIQISKKRAAHAHSTANQTKRAKGLAEGQPAQAAAEQATLVPSHTAEEDMRAHEAAARMQG
jgi:hypothetical protein